VSESFDFVDYLPPCATRWVTGVEIFDVIGAELTNEYVSAFFIPNEVTLFSVFLDAINDFSDKGGFPWCSATFVYSAKLIEESV